MAESLERNESVQVYRKRFLILVLIVFHHLLIRFEMAEYTSISNVLVVYYNTSHPVVALTGSLFSFASIIFFYPVTILVEKCGLRKSIIGATAINVLATSLKCFAVYRSQFILVLIGQFLAGVYKAVISLSYSSVIATWFASNELASTQAIVATAKVYGYGLTFVLPMLITEHNSEHGIFWLSISVMLFSVTLLLATGLLLEEKPVKPPNEAEKFKQIETRWKNLLLDFDYILLAFAFVVAYSTSYTIVATFNQIIFSILPRREIVVIAGLLLTLPTVLVPIYGIVLDRTKKFSACAGISYFLIVLSLVILTSGIYFKSSLIFFLASAVLGLTTNGFLAVARDMALEITYPFSEIRVVAFMQVSADIICFPMIPAFAWLVTHIGAFHSGLILTVITVAGFLAILSIKWKLKRQTMEESRPILRDASVNG